MTELHDALSPALAALLARLDAASDAAVLRQLDSALPRFLARLEPASDAAVLLAAALLSRSEAEGHSCLPLAALDDAWARLREELAATSAAAELPPWPLPAAPAWLDALSRAALVEVRGRDRDCGQPLLLDRGRTPDAARLYLRRYWNHEYRLATALLARCQPDPAPDPALIRAWLQRLFPTAAASSATDWQQLACALACRSRLTLITGGPGTGKTYTAARLLALLLAIAPAGSSPRLALAAPTGKAAARLRQSIEDALLVLQQTLGELPALGLIRRAAAAAGTLHALLGARPDSRHFRHHRGAPLRLDILIVDEASMVDLEMMARLLDALPADTRLILLGDKDQLASVEAGAVLADLCADAEAIAYRPATRAFLGAASGQTLPAPGSAASALADHSLMLRHSHRFDGPIGALAKAAQAGDSVTAEALLASERSGVLQHGDDGDYAGLLTLMVDGRDRQPGYRPYLELLQAGPAEHGAAAHQAWVKAILERFEAFRVLCAVREGQWGMAGINHALEQQLAALGLLRPQRGWYAGRPVMVRRNEAALGVFNGDVGIALPDLQGNLRVHFSDGETLRSVAASRLPEVDTAFAMTVHKSQGSEFRHVVLVLARHAGRVLSRELVYTGITRARSAFSLFCEEGGLLASGLSRLTRRHSGLPQLLAELAPEDSSVSNPQLRLFD